MTVNHELGFFLCFPIHMTFDRLELDIVYLGKVHTA